MTLHIRKFLAMACALVLVFSMTVTASAEDDPSDLIFQMITYYRYYQEDAAMEIDRLTDQLAKIDPAQADAWKNIMDYWSWINTDVEIPIGILPDGLPDDDSLCIVVLGYALESDGSMRSELVGRLEVALASAEKYPNAYIVCTGGGTASENDDVTEAKQMARWLRKHGISSDRIITETDSLSTITNARYTCRILSKSYPEIRHLAIVSSHYHIPRGCLLFHAQGQLSGLENNGTPLDVVAFAGYQAGHNGSTEGMDDVARNLARLAGLQQEDAKKPPLSKLIGLQIGGETVCDVGIEPDLTVSAIYDTGYSRPVTTECNIYGLDLEAAGTQTLTVSYTEKGTTVNATVEISLLPVETEPPPTTEPLATEAPMPASETPEEAESDSPVLLVSVCVLMILGILAAVYPRKKKRRRRRRKLLNI